MSSDGSPHLAGLAPGDRGVVRAVRCARPVARRLMEMGLLPGTEVRVVRVAPLGDPIEVRIRGYSLSIRRAEAAAVSLDHVEAPAPAAQAAEVT